VTWLEYESSEKNVGGPRKINNNINNDRVKLILREIKEYFAIIRSICWCDWITGKNDFTEISKILDSYKSEKNFIRPLK